MELRFLRILTSIRRSLQIVTAPAALAITSLHVSHQLSYNISDVGLSALTRLSALRSLNMVSYGGHLDNRSFRCVEVNLKIYQLPRRLLSARLMAEWPEPMRLIMPQGPAV